MSAVGPAPTTAHGGQQQAAWQRGRPQIQAPSEAGRNEQEGSRAPAGSLGPRVGHQDGERPSPKAAPDHVQEGWGRTSGSPAHPLAQGAAWLQALTGSPLAGRAVGPLVSVHRGCEGESSAPPRPSEHSALQLQWGCACRLGPPSPTPRQQEVGLSSPFYFILSFFNKS